MVEITVDMAGLNNPWPTVRTNSAGINANHPAAGTSSTNPITLSDMAICAVRRGPKRPMARFTPTACTTESTSPTPANTRPVEPAVKPTRS